MRRSVRRLLAVVLVAATAAVTSCSGFGPGVSVREPDFTRPLAVPALADGEVVRGTREFHLTADEGTTDFGQVGRPTRSG